MFFPTYLTQPMDPEKKSLNFIVPTKYVIPKSLKFSHWPSKLLTAATKRCSFLVRDPYQPNEMPLGKGYRISPKYNHNWNRFHEVSFHRNFTKLTLSWHVAPIEDADPTPCFGCFIIITTKINENSKPRNPANELSLHFYCSLNKLMYRLFWQSMLQHAV